MPFSRNKALRFVATTKSARKFAEEFGIVIPGIEVDVENLDLEYILAYTKALYSDMILIAERVKDLWAESMQGKNSLDTRELAKLNKVVKNALFLGNKLLD